MAIELRVDVSEAAPKFEGPLEMAASVCVPDNLFRPEKPVVIIAVPGAGYSRQYYTLEFDEHENYNQAAYHCNRGFIFVALDHMGVGESTIPEPFFEFTLDDIIACQNAAARKIVDLLVSGELDPGVAAINQPVAVGVGQSMGGGLSLLCQSKFAPFDGIAALGWSAVQVYIGKGPDDPGPQPGDDPHAGVAATDFRWAFHWEDVPRDIVHMDLGDDGSMMRMNTAFFNSPTIPPCAVPMSEPGFFTEPVSKITTPVFIGMGERDVTLNAYKEPGMYTGSPDVTLAIFPRMAHMHNFASTREQLWRRLHDWCATVPGIV